MSVSQLCAAGAVYHVRQSEQQAVPETFHELVEFSILASQQDPFDPMEKALRQLGEHSLAQTEHLHRDWSLIREYPLSPQLLALSHVWKSPASDDYVVAVKGAPEAIADLCHLDEAEQGELSRQVSVMASGGLRVLGVAKAHFKHTSTLPGEQHDFVFEYVGLVGLADPVRPMVPQAVRECDTAGIRVVMITGDYPGTAQNIARHIGLKSPDEVITGAELDAMDDAELHQRIKTVTIFARVVPEQKLRLVEALKWHGSLSIASRGTAPISPPHVRPITVAAPRSSGAVAARHSAMPATASRATTTRSTRSAPK